MILDAMFRARKLLHAWMSLILEARSCHAITDPHATAGVEKTFLA